MKEHEVEEIVEEWLNELINELSDFKRINLEKAIANKTVEKLNRPEELLYTFVCEFYENYGRLPSTIVLNK